MKKIKLTQGKFAIVDNFNFKMLSLHKWHFNNGYAKTYIGGKLVYMHRFILNPQKHLDVDHINGNRSDNRICNLRQCTASQNAANQKLSIDNTSGFKGVNKSAKKFRARIQFRGKRICLKSCNTAEESYELYKKASTKLHKEFSKL